MDAISTSHRGATRVVGVDLTLEEAIGFLLIYNLTHLPLEAILLERNTFKWTNTKFFFWNDLIPLLLLNIFELKTSILI